MKELVINEKRYARYEIEGTTLFLHVDIEIVPGNLGASEEAIASIINLIEPAEIKSLGFLNI